MNVDLRLIRKEVIFMPISGRQRKCFCVEIFQDVEDEPNETFTLSFTSQMSNIQFNASQASITIIDDDG